MRRVLLIALPLGAIALLALGAWLLLGQESEWTADGKRRLPKDYEQKYISVLRGEARERVAAKYERWVAEAEFAPIAPADAGGLASEGASVGVAEAPSATAIRDRLLGRVADPDEVASVREEEALIDAFLEQIRIRASESAEVYRDFVESSPDYRWAREGETGSLKGVWEFLWNEAPPAAGARAALEQYWNHSIVERGNRIVGVGVGPLDVKFAISRKREADFSAMGGLTREEHFHLTGMPVAGPTKFMASERRLAEIIERSGSAIGAESHALLKLANGGVVSWVALWGLDPSTERWFVDRTVFSRATYAEFFF